MGENKSYQGAKIGPFQGVTHSRQGDGHGCYGQGRLQGQGPIITGRLEYLQDHHQDPTNKFKNELSETLRDIKAKEDSVTTVTGR